MDDNFFGNYGVQSGYGQVAPGRDVERARQQGQPGRPRNQQVINDAIAPPPQSPMQALPQAVFEGARQTGVAGYAAPRGGVTGGRVSVPPAQAPAPAAPAAPQQSSIPDFSQWGQYGHGALNQQKIDSGHDSPKYAIARVLSNFDPRQGLTPDAIAALNTLGIGQFSSDNGQYLRVANADPRFEGYTGADMVRNFKAGDESTRWGGWGSVGAEGPGVKQAPQGIPGVPFIQQAITGGQPPQANFAERIRAQVMQALANRPGLASLSKF